MVLRGDNHRRAVPRPEPCHVQTWKVSRDWRARPQIVHFLKAESSFSCAVAWRLLDVGLSVGSPII